MPAAAASTSASRDASRFSNRRFSIATRNSAICNLQSAMTSSLIRNNVRPLARIRTRDDGDDRLGGADVEDFVGHARLDEDEIAGGVFHDLLQGIAVFVAD